VVSAAHLIDRLVIANLHHDLLQVHIPGPSIINQLLRPPLYSARGSRITRKIYVVRRGNYSNQTVSSVQLLEGGNALL
jgi:hypothetical protein